jgi:hypothetical protein
MSSDQGDRSATSFGNETDRESHGQVAVVDDGIPLSGLPPLGTQTKD